MSESVGQSAVSQPLVEGHQRLSFSEELLWFSDRARAGSIVFLECPFNLSMALRLENRLDVPALRSSLQEIVRRHAVLRSRYPERDGRPLRIIEASTRIPFPEIDLRSLPAPGQAAAVDRLLASQVHRAFDVQSGPLLRAGLLVLADEVHIFAVTVHHIVFDGWSRHVLSRELGALYYAYSTGQPCQLPEPSASYPDYVLWQHARLQGDTAHRLMEAWTARLGSPTELRLPSDQPPGHRTSGRAGSCHFTVPAQQTDALRALSRTNGVTVANTMLALFTLLLHKIAGALDIVVGVPISDRRRREFEDLIGLFNNVLVVRADLSGNPDFLALLKRVRKGLQDAYGQQDLPYWYFVKSQAAATGKPLNAPFRVVFNFMSHAPQHSQVEFEGLKVEALAVGNQPPSLADLSLHGRDQGDILACRLLYKPELFSSRLAERFADQFMTLLALVLDLPAIAIAEYKVS